MREKIQQLYIEGYSAKEIAYKLGKTEVSVKKFISRNLKQFKQIHNEYRELRQSNTNENIDKIQKLYLKGYNAKEIGKLMCLSHGYIRNLISKHLKEYGQEHRKARDLNKSIIKAINTINNSYIGNSALLKQNRQSYIYNKNDNLVFDEETRGTRPDDIPKVFYKRNSM